MWAIVPLLLPFTKGIATFPSHEICIDGESGNTIPCFYLDEDFESNKTEWDCDIKSWTRAPDLIPGHSIPAETRLWMNGSACGDVIGWEVGMRMLERAIIKIRNPDVQFPTKPVRKPYNGTAGHVDMIQDVDSPDWNDIYRVRDGGWIMNRDDSKYEPEWEIYSAASRNKSLFIVDGQERVVFDQRVRMDLSPFTSKDLQPINHLKGFSIDVPLTNFPPVKTYEGSMGSGKHEQVCVSSFDDRTKSADDRMLNTENMFEYYHLLTLQNGTILDIPAGRSGFLPEPYPISPQSIEMEEMEWPAVISLDSPKGNDARQDDVLDHLTGRDAHNKRPECDAGNRAEFVITVSSTTKAITPDQNITLAVHLARTGNGSEYPAYIDISLSTYENVTFAYDQPQISSSEAYYSLIRDDGDGRNRYNDFSHHPEILIVQNQESLERRKRSLEEQRRTIMMGERGRWPARRGTARYDFEEVYKGITEREELDFDIEFSIPYNAFPNFEKVFSTHTPQLSFELQTAFLCAKPADPASVEKNEKSETEKLDEEWQEWTLPTTVKSRTSLGGRLSRYSRHTGTLPLYIHRNSNLTPDQQSRLVHYLDPAAKAPRLSSTIISKIVPLTDDSEFELVEQVNRKEEGSELKQSRYDLYASGRQHQPRCARRNGNIDGCWSQNNGGGGMHAAKLWQRMEEEKKAGGQEEGSQLALDGEQVVLAPF